MDYERQFIIQMIGSIVLYAQYGMLKTLAAYILYLYLNILWSFLVLFHRYFLLKWSSRKLNLSFILFRGYCFSP